MVILFDKFLSFFGSSLSASQPSSILLSQKLLKCVMNAPSAAVTLCTMSLMLSIARRLLLRKDGGPAKWGVTVSGELRFMTSHLESSSFLIVTPLIYLNYIENQI